MWVLLGLCWAVTPDHFLARSTLRNPHTGDTASWVQTQQPHHSIKPVSALWFFLTFMLLCLCFLTTEQDKTQCPFWGADSALAALKGSPNLAQGTEGTLLSPGMLPQSDNDICMEPVPAGCTSDSLYQHTSASLTLAKPVSPCKRFYRFMMVARIRNFHSCWLVWPVRNVTFSSTSK